MIYDERTATLEIDDAELAGAAEAIDVTVGPLAPARLGPRAQSRRAFEASLARLNEIGREALEELVSALADPSRLVHVHASTADGMLSRAAYAFDDSRITVLATSAEGNVIRHADRNELVDSIVAPMLGGPTLPADIRLELDARAVIALVAAGDALRYARMAALAAHSALPETFSAADVAARIADSRVDDPRWNLNLFVAVMPLDPAEFMDGATCELALWRLAEAGLLVRIEPDAVTPALYHPTDEGAAVLETLAYATARVGVTVLERPARDSVAYETMLLVRGPWMVTALDFAPEGGGMMPISPAAITMLAERLAGGNPE